MKINKKGYVFTLDVTIAIIVLVLGVSIMFYHFVSIDKNVYFTEQLSEDLIGVMAYTTINDLCVNPDDPATCDCPNYTNLTTIVCSGVLRDVNASMLSMISEIIETSAFNGSIVRDLIRETFVSKKVVDEIRFGFAILYTDMDLALPYPLELYNTETYPTP